MKIVMFGLPVSIKSRRQAHEANSHAKRIAKLWHPKKDRWQLTGT